MSNLLALILLVFALFLPASCGGLAPGRPATGPEEDSVMAELQGRSFRQFEPSKDADKRKGVILDFFGPVTLWAQYAEGGYAVSEWEIVAADYRLEKHGDSSTFTIHFVEPETVQQFPSPCEGCIDTGGVSLSVRDVFDEDRISFRINDPDGVLPSPFPVFQSWTRFPEDEYQN